MRSLLAGSHSPILFRQEYFRSERPFLSLSAALYLLLRWKELPWTPHPSRTWTRSPRALLEKARQSLAGGVSSPFRAKFPAPL
jgi:hypothetical protein